MSPRDPELFHFQIAATGHFVAGRYAEAADWARRCLGTRDIPAAYRLLAASLGHLGDRSAARAPVERLPG